MLTIDFKHRLRQLDSRFEVRGNSDKVGIYRKVQQRNCCDVSCFDMHYADWAERRYLQDSAAGLMDQFICGIHSTYMPEYDILDLESGRIIYPGYRRVLMKIANVTKIPIERIRKVFKLPSLGQDDYDRRSYTAQLALEREGTPYA